MAELIEEIWSIFEEMQETESEPEVAPDYLMADFDEVYNDR